MRIMVNHPPEQGIAVDRVLRRIKNVLMPELVQIVLACSLGHGINMKPGLLCNSVRKRTYSARAASALSRDQPCFSIKASRTELSSSSSGTMPSVFAESEALTKEKVMSPTMKRIKIRIGIACTASWRRQSAPVISLIYAAILNRIIKNAKPGARVLTKFS